MENYHKILEVKANASKREIKSAYRKLALKYHPDKNESKDAQKMFVLINFAYEVLHNDLVPKTHFKTDEYTPSEHPFEKWKDINTPPRDINEFKEWKKVKQDQTKENHKK